MSTTSAADLIAHADLLTRELRHCDVPITRQQWQSFDLTLHRLMRELLEPGPCARPSSPRGAHTAALQVLHAYPDPLRPRTAVHRPGQDLTAPDRPPEVGRRTAQRGPLYAVPDGDSVRTAAPDPDPQITPADLSDPHPVARLACTLGALADLLTIEQNSHHPAVLESTDIAGIYSHVLSLAYVAARHALIHGATADADRPLAIAQYAEAAVDALRDSAQHPRALDRITSISPAPAPTSLNDQLEAAVHHWANMAQRELQRMVPSAEVLRGFANQGVHLCAVTHRFVTGPSALPLDSAQRTDLDNALRDGAQALRRADRSWISLTTAARPSHEFVTTSRLLFTTLVVVSRTSADTAPADYDPARALRDLDRGIRHFATLLQTTRPLPDRLIRAGLLFAPAAATTPTVERLAARRRKQLTIVTARDVPELLTSWADAADRTAALSLSLRGITLGADRPHVRLPELLRP